MRTRYFGWPATAPLASAASGRAAQPTRLCQVIGFCFCASFMTLGSDAAAVEFYWFEGDPLTNERPRAARAVSPDGRTTTGDMRVGIPPDSNTLAYVARDGVFRSIGSLPGDTTASGYLLSRDGQTVVGTSSNDLGSWRTFRWTETEGMVDLGRPRGEASALSADGSVIVGVVGRDPQVTSGEAYRWTSAEGLQRILDHDSLGAVSSIARDVSDDGRVAVGSFNTRDRIVPFRWTEGNGIEVLPDLAGGHDWASAQHILPSGDIVGVGWNEAGAIGVVWGDAGSIESIPNMKLPEGVPGSFQIRSISDDRKIAILEPLQPGGYDDCLWTESQGSRDALAVLHDDFGVPADYYLEILGMTADGTRLVGSGSIGNSHGIWQITLTPPPLAADADFDGQISLADFVALKRGFGRDRPFRRYGNFDGDLDVDMDDFGVLKATFGDRGAPSQPVPEPPAGVLLAVGMLGTWFVRRRCARSLHSRPAALPRRRVASLSF